MNQINESLDDHPPGTPGLRVQGRRISRKRPVAQLTTEPRIDSVGEFPHRSLEAPAQVEEVADQRSVLALDVGGFFEEGNAMS
jgi:hypothetical protein